MGRGIMMIMMMVMMMMMMGMMMITMLILEHKGRLMKMMMAMMIAMLMITMSILEHKGRPPHPTQASGSDPLEKMFAQSLFHYFLCVFQKLGIFWVINAQCLVSSVLNMCTRFPYIALNFTPKCWMEAGGQCWTWEQIGGGWLVGMPMTKMPKSRDSHNATRRSHNAMWTRDNSRNMMRSKLQASSQAPWEAKREADVSIQFC